MRRADVQLLLAYEARTGESVASWHVRGLWDKNKERVESDTDAHELSAAMRSLQDVYLRCLFALRTAGRTRFLTTLLRPDFAYCEHTFIGLDPGRLTFDSYETAEVRTPLRQSLVRRSVRIALDELPQYVEKTVEERKLRSGFEDVAAALIEQLVELASEIPMTEIDDAWQSVAESDDEDSIREVEMGPLLEIPSPDPASDKKLRDFLEERLYEIGASLNLFP
jgi:hypothetical protein